MLAQFPCQSCVPSLLCCSSPSTKQCSCMGVLIFPAMKKLLFWCTAWEGQNTSDVSTFQHIVYPCHLQLYILFCDLTGRTMCFFVIWAKTMLTGDRKLKTTTSHTIKNTWWWLSSFCTYCTVKITNNSTWVFLVGQSLLLKSCILNCRCVKHWPPYVNYVLWAEVHIHQSVIGV